MRNNNNAIGFISAPSWLDPAPDEFRAITQGKISIQQTFLDPPGFDYSIKSITEIEPHLINAALSLASAGCSLIASPATPFGYMGFDNITKARENLTKITKTSGVECISSISAIFDLLEINKPQTLALACTYYQDDWKDLWTSFVRASGYEVIASQSLVDQGIRKQTLDEVDYPNSDEICESIKIISKNYPNIDAIIISGSGARTMAITDKLKKISNKLIIAADTALFSIIAKKLNINLPIKL
jgi:maleate cis-trans isomerase